MTHTRAYARTHSRFPPNLPLVLSLYLITGGIDTDAEELRINEGRHERLASRRDEKLKRTDLFARCIARSFPPGEMERDGRSYLLFAKGY